MSQLNSALELTYEGDFTLAQHSPFRLLSGDTLPQVTLHYAIYGALNEARDNAILVPHALSGSARVADWWPQLFGADAVFDLTKDCVIGINMIGSCYGSTGPTSINPSTEKPYGRDFPLVTVKDNVRAQVELIRHLGIQKLRVVIGGSIGGMQAIQWAIDYPEMVEHSVAVGSAPLSAMALALNHLQRQAILDNPQSGLSLARQIAMISYKSAELFAERYGRRPNRNGEDPHQSFDGRYDVGGYLNYQGEIFLRRFDPDSYLIITKLMDNFDPSTGYESVQTALERIKARVLLIGIESDWLFPVTDVEALAQQMKRANVDVEYARLITTHGHDGFLAEPHQLIPLIRNFIEPDRQEEIYP
ncbi:MAG: homoserine O-acetyltransferase [Acidobacteria bacterium]|nr:homoserine O-acetyltransferase [Acidobacteriota bacterium]